MTPEQALFNLVQAAQSALMNAQSHALIVQSAQCLDALVKANAKPEAVDQS